MQLYKCSSTKEAGTQTKSFSPPLKPRNMALTKSTKVVDAIRRDEDRILNNFVPDIANLFRYFGSFKISYTAGTF